MVTIDLLKRFKDWATSEHTNEGKKERKFSYDCKFKYDEKRPGERSIFQKGRQKALIGRCRLTNMKCDYKGYTHDICPRGKRFE